MEKKKMKIYKRINQFEHIFFSFSCDFSTIKCVWVCVFSIQFESVFHWKTNWERWRGRGRSNFECKTLIFSAATSYPILSAEWKDEHRLLGICMNVVIPNTEYLLKDTNKYTEFLIQQKIPKINNLMRL